MMPSELNRIGHQIAKRVQAKTFASAFRKMIKDGKIPLANIGAVRKAIRKLEVGARLEVDERPT